MESSANPPTISVAPAHAGPGYPILGIDPGLRRTGYAVLIAPTGADACRVVEAGLIRLNPTQPIEQRLVELQRGLEELISTHRPTVLACEQLYSHYKHPRTAVVMAHARGVILALAARRGLDVVNVAATQVKRYLTGSGRAGKAQVQRAVAAALCLPQIPESSDVADAMAVALCGLRMRDAERRVRPAAKGGRR